jgi:anti-sigma regulatory factor (Ser/Thr protein kinase)/putative methionine-R-sulfoxide reductase with GAF domain
VNVVAPDGTSAGAADRLRDIESLTDADLGDLNIEDLLAELLDRSLAALGADTATVLLLDASGDRLVATTTRGLEAEVYQGVRIPLGRGFAGRIAAGKQPLVVDDIETADVVNPLLRDAGLHSLVGVPLTVAGRVLGVLHVGSRARRQFTEADVELLQVVGDRIALATHAHLAEDERTAAMALQRSLLPDRLPHVAGLEAALRYSAGGGGDVGGDWYDMFVLPSHWVCITVGDVVGRGLRAAVIMGRLRSALRSYALASEPDPAVILEQADHKLQHFEPGEMATAVVALIDPSLARMHVSVAGHPAPVLALVTGPARYADVDVDPPLGVHRTHLRRRATFDLDPGTVAAFYTDGLVERRGVPLRDRIDLLCRAVTPSPPEAVCMRVMGSLVGQERPPDDVALLVLRRSPSGADAPVVMTYPAVARSLGAVRAGVRRWLADAGATSTDEFNVLLAVGEATSNVVEHAYGPEGGAMTVTLAVHRHVATVTVSDDGHWRMPRGANRGRGGSIMDAVTDEVRVDRRPDGTDVRFRYRLGQDGLL